MVTHPTKRKLGELDVYQLGDDPKAPYLMLFHGYGANAFDLMPLSQNLLVGRNINYLFPDGRISVDVGYGMMGKAWFPIDMVAFQEAMMRGEHRDLSGGLPEGFIEAREVAQEMLDALDVPMDRIILGGFSQGAMLAIDLSLRSKTPPIALLILSGTLVDSENLRKLALKRAGLPFFQSHGTADPLLPYVAAERLNKLLNEAGLKGELHTFYGGHEIPQDILLKLNAFLENIL
ncbi:MAG: alpha/beta hydrolase [bacterium]